MRTPGPVVERYDYRDESGALLFQVQRHEPKDFTQRRPNGKGWINDVKGVRRVLYRLPLVAEAAAAGRVVLLCEGEKDVHAAESLELVATCNSMGAEKWDDGYTESLRGAHVVIVPDNDAAGARHAEKVARKIYGAAASVRILPPLVDTPGGDLADYVAGGGTAEALRTIIKDTPLYAPPKPDFMPEAPPAVSIHIDTSRVEAYARAGLRYEADELARMGPDTGRNNKLNVAAKKMGSYAAIGALHRQDAEAALTAAMHLNGYVKEKGIRAVQKTFESGFTAGLKEPFDPATMRDNSARTEVPVSGDGAVAPVSASGRAQGAPDTGTDVHRLNDVGNARRLLAAHGEDVRYCHPQATWYMFDHQRWAPDETAEIMRRAIETARSIYTEAARTEDANERKALANHAKATESAAKLRAMVDAASWMEGVAVRPDELDRDPWLLNVRNGTIDLRTGEIRPADRADLITRMAGTAYDPGATCPTFMATLSRAMNHDAELIAYLQRWFGYGLTGDTGEQVMTLFFGTGANGKSTIIEAVAAVLGDYAQQTPAETLANRRSEGVPNDLARLRGARFVSAVETGEGSRLAENLVKQLTGGDRITARFLRQEFFEFTPCFKMVLATNHKPVIKGTDEAIWRRLHLVPFSVTIPPAERDKRLRDKLQPELPGILNWMIAGCLEWQRVGLNPPASVEAATKEYREEMDVLAAFIEDRCIQVASAETPSSRLHAAYTAWCEENGERPMSNKAFSMRMVEKGYNKVKQKDGAKWIGLACLAKEGPDYSGDG
jgi:P4 family phage/plasmid primase-like protien